MNYIDLLNIGQKKLRKKKISTSFIDSEILLSYVLKISRERLLCNLDKKLSKNQIRLFKKLIKLRLRRMPIAYITNRILTRNFFCSHN